MVFYSRRRGEYLELDAREAAAHQQSVELMLSIHLNSSASSQAAGASCYYFASGNYRSPYGYRLANHVQDALVGECGRVDCRAHGRTYRLLRETRMPVVIVEPAFITNPREESLLGDRSFLESIAHAIAVGAGEYFNGVKALGEE